LLDPDAQIRVIELWESIVGVTDQAATSNDASAIRVGKATPPGWVTEHIAIIRNSIELNLPDGTCFWIRKDDSNIYEIEQSLKFMYKIEFEVEGRPFEIFYRPDLQAEETGEIMSAFQNQGFVKNIMDNISSKFPVAFDSGIPSSRLRDPVDPSRVKICNPNGAYRIFMVSTGGSSDTLRGPGGRSYIKYNATQISKEHYRGFIREEGKIDGGQDYANGLAAHEWYHAVSVAFGTLNWDKCEDAMADAWSENSTASGEASESLAGHLYSPATSLCLGTSTEKSYGSSLLFWYIRDLFGNPPLKAYFDLVHSGTPTYDALKTATSSLVPGGLPVLFQRFAETSLNLEYPNIYRFLNAPNHPQYKNFNLVNAVSIVGLMDLIDNKITIKFDQLDGMGIRYIALITGTSDTINNYFKFTVNNWGGEFSVLGIKVDKDNAQKYKVTYYGIFDKSKGNTMEAKFAEPDTEPDILILVFSNSDKPGNYKAGEVVVESRPFSERFPISVEYIYDNTGSGGTIKTNLSMLVTMDPQWRGDWISPAGNQPLSGALGTWKVELPKTFPWDTSAGHCLGGSGSTQSEYPPRLIGHYEEAAKTGCLRMGYGHVKITGTKSTDLDLDLNTIDPKARVILIFTPYNADKPGTGKAQLGWCFESMDKITLLTQSMLRDLTCNADGVTECCAGLSDPLLTQCETTNNPCIPPYGQYDFYGNMQRFGIPYDFSFLPDKRLTDDVLDTNDCTNSTRFKVDIGPLPETIEAWSTFPPRRILYIPDAPNPDWLGQFIPMVIDIKP
jgi:hypothetical protein